MPPSLEADLAGEIVRMLAPPNMRNPVTPCFSLVRIIHEYVGARAVVVRRDRLQPVRPLAGSSDSVSPSADRLKPVPPVLTAAAAKFVSNAG